MLETSRNRTEENDGGDRTRLQHHETPAQPNVSALTSPRPGASARVLLSSNQHGFNARLSAPLPGDSISEEPVSTRDLSDFVTPHQTNILHSHQMGQGASTPQNDGREIQNHGASRSSQQDEATGSRGTWAQSTPETRPNETTTALRRSRRLRNHIDHFARIGSRLLPNSSSSSTSSSVGSRMHNIRNRRSRLPSPSSTPGGGSSPNRTSLSSRQRIRGYTSRPQLSFDPEIRNSTSDVDMVDISAVPSGGTRTPTPPTPSLEAPATESRRSRMARVRSSIPSLADLIGSRRPGHSNFNRNSALLSFNNNINSSADMDTDMSHAEVTPSSQSSDSSPSRLERTAGGSGVEEYDNPARVRPGEDQAAMLSRLLSVAAAATAASLVGNTEQAITEAQDVAGDNGGDGSFESFLRALQNGRLAAALRNGGNELGGGAPPDANQADNTLMAPLNFFRMFRFGSTNNNEGNGNGESGEGSRSRMVPVIIVGIRSVTPRDSTDGGADRPAPFFDALANLPVNLPSIHRRPRLSNNHRRASMGGTPASPSGYDSQRHSRATSSNSLRPVSDISPASIPILSDTPPGPHPPPSTPADPSLLSFPNPSFSNDQTSAERSEGPDENMSSGARDQPSRRRLSRRLSSSDSIPPFNTLGGRSAGSNNNNNSAGSSSNTAGSGSGPRRPPGNAEGTRSWIIYVLGGSYPEDHPILTTPSLFTDAPTYEDMMLLSSLLGPAKPPVATRDDVNSAGGIFVFGEETTLNVSIVEGDRCLICLGDYEKSEECRLLSKCQHVFHRECIDEWLTTGRNSCPLCRSQGVNEKEQPPTASADAPPANPVDGTAAS